MIPFSQGFIGRALSLAGTSTVLALVFVAPVRAADDMDLEASARVRQPRTVDLRPVGLVINGQTLGEACLVVVEGNRLMVRRDDVAQWDLAPPFNGADVIIEGQAFVPLDTIEGLSARLDSVGETLIVDADPRLFPAMQFGRHAKRVEVDPVIPAAFISYELSVMDWDGAMSGAAYLDGGVSGAWGLVGTTALIQTGGAGTVRLESAFQRDFPDRRIRLVVGDTTTRGAEWNRPARFAGVRMGTDFSLSPDEINYPLPVLTGTASIPSAVELAAAGSSQAFSVQPGPFTIDYQPVFSGAGDVTMTIRDDTGIARRITQSFYTSPRLLRPGLDDFSFEAGFLREDYGRRSFAYGDPFAAAYWRHGLSANLTVAGRIEAGSESRMAGLGFGLILMPLGEFSIAGALSDGRSGSGSFWRAQFQRLSRHYSITASYQRTSAGFAQIGDPSHIAGAVGQAREELAVAGSLAIGRFGNLSASVLNAKTGDGSRYVISAVSYSANLGRAYLSVGANRTHLPQGNRNSLFGSVSVPLGTRGSASVMADDTRVLATLSRTPPNDQGVGYRLAVGRDSDTGDAVLSASTTIRTRAGDIEIAADRNRGGQGARVTARGALVGISGKVVATPRLDYAFALIEVDGDADVTLYYENRPVAVKGGKGRGAILTGLQPYAANRISIDVDAVPIDAAIEAAEKLVVPGYRQATRVAFGGARAHPATVMLVDENGMPLEPGLAVASGTSPMGLTGYDGAVFIPDVIGGQRLSISGPRTACEARLPLDAKAINTDRIGPIICQPHNQEGPEE